MDLPPLPAEMTARGVAELFFQVWGDLLPISEKGAELRYDSTRTNEDPPSANVWFRQFFRDVPIESSRISVGLDDEMRVTSYTGSYVPNVCVDTVPEVSAMEAEAIATEGGWSIVSSPELQISAAKIHNVLGPNFLMWFIVRGIEGDPLSEQLVLVNAHTGELLQ